MKSFQGYLGYTPCSRVLAMFIFSYTLMIFDVFNLCVTKLDCMLGNRLSHWTKYLKYEVRENQYESASRPRTFREHSHPGNSITC